MAETTDTREPADLPGDGPAVGTVAEEMARLVQLLSTYRGAGGPKHGPGEPGRDQPRRPEPGQAEPGQAEPGQTETGSDGSARREPGQREPGQREPGRDGSGSDGPPAACRACPLCQLIAFVQQVSPETIERLADVVELAATGLRDLAVVQRQRRATGGEEPP